VIILNAAGLRRVLDTYVEYDTGARTHLALEKDAPLPRPVALPTAGRVVAIPQLGGLHHRYERRAA
jgi:putative transposase